MPGCSHPAKGRTNSAQPEGESNDLRFGSIDGACVARNTGPPWRAAKLTLCAPEIAMADMAFFSPELL